MDGIKLKRAYFANPVYIGHNNKMSWKDTECDITLFSDHRILIVRRSVKPEEVCSAWTSLYNVTSYEIAEEVKETHARTEEAAKEEVSTEEEAKKPKLVRKKRKA